MLKMVLMGDVHAVASMMQSRAVRDHVRGLDPWAWMAALGYTREALRGQAEYPDWGGGEGEEDPVARDVDYWSRTPLRITSLNFLNTVRARILADQRDPMFAITMDTALMTENEHAVRLLLMVHPSEQWTLFLPKALTCCNRAIPEMFLDLEPLKREGRDCLWGTIGFREVLAMVVNEEHETLEALITSGCLEPRFIDPTELDSLLHAATPDGLEVLTRFFARDVRFTRYLGDFLWMMVREGSAEHVRGILNAGFALATETETAMARSASANGFAPVLEAFLDRGDDCHADKEQCLSDALMRRNPDCVRLLLAAGAEVNRGEHLRLAFISNHRGIERAITQALGVTMTRSRRRSRPPARLQMDECSQIDPDLYYEVDGGEESESEYVPDEEDEEDEDPEPRAKRRRTR